MSVSLANKLAFLRRVGAEASDHSGWTLMQHLMGTRLLLEQWRANEGLCDAGLFHSIYGTATYCKPLVPFSDRRALSEILGAETEELVFLFCARDRESFFQALSDASAEMVVRNRVEGGTMFPSRQSLIDVIQIDAANILEQWPRLPAAYYPRASSLLQQIRPYILCRGQDAIDNAVMKRQAQDESCS